jgi:hypothetical protein
MCSREESGVPCHIERLDFVERSLADPEFNRLFNLWEERGFLKGESPSFDRVNPLLGYSWDNVQWVTWDENRFKGTTEDSRIHRDAGTYGTRGLKDLADDVPF